jgi:hypothetical protein
MSAINANASGQFRIGDMTINRLGYGAMWITGPRNLGTSCGPRRGARHVATAPGDRRQFHRHRRQLRP